MRHAWLVIPWLILFAAPAAAQPADEVPPAATEPEIPDPDAAAEPEGPEGIDALFKTLQTTEDEAEADRAERAILASWLRSGSDTIDLLMRWSMQAIDEKKYQVALDLLDSVTTLKPDYAEGWNKRATTYFMIGNYGQSIADIETVLRIEPRHFGALSGLGLILRDVGKREEALAIFRHALEINPTLEKVREAAEELEKETAGQET